MRTAVHRMQHCCGWGSTYHASPSLLLSTAAAVSHRHRHKADCAGTTAAQAHPTTLNTAPTSHQPRLLDSSTGPAVLQQLDTLMFDQDGVLWRGQDLIPNAVEVSTHRPGLTI
jgi:hypothetical protein